MVWVSKDQPVKIRGQSEEVATRTDPPRLPSSTKVFPRPMSKVDAVVTELAHDQTRKTRPGRPSQRSRERRRRDGGTEVES